MRTARGQRTLHTARCILAEHAKGKQVPQMTIDWARAIVRANAPRARAFEQQGEKAA